MRRVRYLKLSVVWLLLMWATTPLMAEAFLGVDRERISSVVDAAYNLEAGVEADVERLIQNFPESPVPDFIRAVRLYWIQAYAKVDDELGEEYERVGLEALKKAKAYWRSHDDDPDALFIVAMSELSLAKYYVEHKRWLAGFWKARSGIGGVRRVLKQNPDHQDAKLAMGMANCFLSQAPGYIKPFALLMRFSGDMEKGLRFMEESKEGLFTQADAYYYLAAIQWGLRKKPDLAYVELQFLAKRFPNNVEFQYQLGKVEHTIGKLREAIDRFEMILNSEVIEDYPYLKGIVGERLAKIYGKEKQFKKMLQAATALKEAGEEGKAYERFTALYSLFGGDAKRGLGNEDEAYELYRSIGEEHSHLFEEAAQRIADIDAKREAAAQE